MKDKAAVWVSALSHGGHGCSGRFALPEGRRCPEEEWARLVYLLSGVEAIAFAAAGYFFGREVNRARAEAAEEDANVSRDESRRAQDRATRAEKHGQSLADLSASAPGQSPRRARSGCWRRPRARSGWAECSTT